MDDCFIPRFFMLLVHLSSFFLLFFLFFYLFFLRVWLQHLFVKRNLWHHQWIQFFFFPPFVPSASRIWGSSVWGGGRWRTPSSRGSTEGWTPSVVSPACSDTLPSFRRKCGLLDWFMYFYPPKNRIIIITLRNTNRVVAKFWLCFWETSAGNFILTLPAFLNQSCFDTLTEAAGLERPGEQSATVSVWQKPNVRASWWRPAGASDVCGADPRSADARLVAPVLYERTSAGK